jgi:hypothetical protein
MSPSSIRMGISFHAGGLSRPHRAGEFHLYAVSDAFLAVLDGYTLADLLKPHEALSALFLSGQQPSIHAN